MKKYFYALVGCVGAATLLASCSSTQAQKKNGPELGPNLVRNSSFEDGASGWNLKTAKVVSTQAHSGKRSLEYTNRNPKNYQLIQQDIPIKPGQALHFSTLVKGENVTTSALWQAKGAGIFVQSYDADGKYISGAFPFYLTGTFDWTPVEGFYIVPEKAARAVVGLYLRKETVGKVWFDDVTVQVEKPRLFKAFLQYPNYRGITTTQSKDPWQVLIKNQIPAEWKSAVISSRIQDSTGKVIFENQQTLSASEEGYSLRWKPTQTLAPGNYSWQIEIISPDGKKRTQEYFPIRVQPEMPRVHIDAKGFTRIDGERFFPFGIYTGKSGERGSLTTSPEHLQRMSDAGLNMIFSYMYGERDDAEKFVDEADRHDLKVIYNLKELYNGADSFPHLDQSATTRALNLVEKFKNHPALLAWYTNDEFGYGEIPAIQKRYEEIATVDDHPVYQVQNKLEVLPWNYSSADVIGTDPYPARRTDSQLGSVTEHLNKTTEVSAGSKGIWQVAQIHDHSLHKGEGVPPTLDQMRNMSYQNLIGGAKGLLYYAYHWLYLTRNEKKVRVVSDAAYEKRWPDVEKMLREVKTFLPIILKDQKIALQSTSPSVVPYQAWQDADRLYLMVANPKPEAAVLDLQIPVGWRLDEQSVTGITPKLSGQKLQLNFAPIASGVLVLTK